MSACSSGGSSGNPEITELNDEGATGSTTGATDGDTTGSTTSATDGDTTGSTTSTTGGIPTSPVSQFGYIGVSNEEPIYFDASFFSFPQQITFPTLLSELRPTSDYCEVLDLFDTGDDIDDIDGFDGFDITSISAGDVLTISSPAGSYAELTKSEQFGFIFYELDDNVILPAPVPDNLSVSFPGDQFPAFTSVALPIAEPLLVSSPSALEQSTASTTFSWTPSSDSNSRIELSLSSFSAAGFILVNCTIVDDGSFAFPAAIQSQMGAASGIVDMSRETISVTQRDNAVLFTSTTAERAN